MSVASIRTSDHTATLCMEIHEICHTLIHFQFSSSDLQRLSQRGICTSQILKNTDTKQNDTEKEQEKEDYHSIIKDTEKTHGTWCCFAFLINYLSSSFHKSGVAICAHFYFVVAFDFMVAVYFATGSADKHDFQAETSMLLDIVAKSLYSDKEVCRFW